MKRLKKEGKDIQIAVEKIRKSYHGNVSIKKSDSLPCAGEDSVVSTGIIELDNALGIGGIRKGSIVEIYGPEGVGKTSVALHLAKQYQDKGMSVLYIDTEKSLMKENIKRMGINEDSFYLLDSDNLEESLDSCVSVSSSFGAIIIDSIAGLPTKAQMNGEIGDCNVGCRARILSDAFSILVHVLAKNGCTLIFTNQLRQKVGVLFGNPETTTGGRAHRYYTSSRIDLRMIETLKDKSEYVGIRVRAKIVKNKASVPYKEATFNIWFKSGIKSE